MLSVRDWLELSARLSEAEAVAILSFLLLSRHKRFRFDERLAIALEVG